jgi:ribosomal protein S6--L-glutamate ligase
MTTVRRQRPRIAFLLGKPVREGTMFPAVFDRLRGASALVSVHLPKGDDPLPPWVFDVDLVVQRGLGTRELMSARSLEEAGIRCCNSISGTIDTGARAVMSQKLANAGLPVPNMARAETWTEVLSLAAGQPVVIKAADGSVGRGLGVRIAATGELPSDAPFAGPYLIQEHIQSDGRDHKLYVAGDQVRGLLKRWPPQQPSDKLGVPFEVGPELANTARQAGKALNLEVYGVDILYGARGLAIIDVNPFPGFRGVTDGAEMIANYLTDIATGRQ